MTSVSHSTQDKKHPKPSPVAQNDDSDDQNTQDAPHATSEYFQICLYVPNIVGWLRFIFLFLAPKYAFHQDKLHYFAIYLTISELLDGIDGKLARMFNQCSNFGAAMDMIADRAAIAICYLVLLCGLKNFLYSYIFITCLILDFGSHYLQFLSSALAKVSHKGKNKKENLLVAFYYSNPLFFQFICLAAEFSCISMFFIIYEPSWMDSLPFMACSIVLLSALTFKMIVNFFQWKAAHERIEDYCEGLQRVAKGMKGIDQVKNE